MPNYTFLRSKLNVAKGGLLRLDLGDIPKGAISIWAGGKPIPVDGSSPAIPFADGESWIFVGINRDLIGDRPIRIRVDTEGSTAKLAP
jgi:hypothetical protein